MSNSKAKIYKIDRDTRSLSNDKIILKFAVEIVVYAIVLYASSKLFEDFYITNFTYAIVSALILSFLNYYVRPVIVFLTLPLNILTLGLSYPIINVILLNGCDLLMGKHFIISGFLSAFVISIFISIFKIILDRIITKNV